jgi:hypothetical protein
MLFYNNGLGALNPFLVAVSDQTQGLPAVGACSSDGKFIWQAGPDGTAVGGSWARLRVGEVCQSVSTNVGPTTTVHDGSGGTILPAPDTSKQKFLKVGPFVIPYESESFAIHWSTLLPKDWQDFINAELAHDCSGCVSSSMRPATPGHPFGALRDFLGSGMPTQINIDFAVRPTGDENSFGLCGLPYIYDPLTADMSNWNPIVFTQNPDTGEDFGIYMYMSPRDCNKPWDSTTNPFILNLIWRKIDRHWYDSVWSWIKHIVAEVIQIAQTVICDVACTPAAVQAAMKSNPYAAIGGIIAIGLCKCPIPTAIVAPVPWYRTYWYAFPIAAVVILALASQKSKPRPALQP